MDIAFLKNLIAEGNTLLGAELQKDVFNRWHEKVKIFLNQSSFNGSFVDIFEVHRNGKKMRLNSRNVIKKQVPKLEAILETCNIKRNEVNMPKIFISHSSKDKALVDIFVDELLICGLEFSSSDIFCTCVDGLGIKTGEDWRNKIKAKLIGSKVIILFITPNYKESEICLNEMGAAWTTDAKTVPIIVPHVDYETMSVIFDVKQAVLLTKQADLDGLRDLLQDEFSTKNLPTARWTSKTMEAVAAFKQVLEKSPFQTPLSRDELTKLEIELKETKEAFNNVVAEKRELSEYCRKLENAKDKQDVVAIKRDVGLLKDYDIFLEKAKEVGKGLSEFNTAVRTIIFYEYTQNGLKLTGEDRRSLKDDLIKARAKGIIDEEESLNREHSQVKKVLKLLDDFGDFFPKNISCETYEKLESEHPDILLEMSSSDFWSDIFGVKLYI